MRNLLRKPAIEKMVNQFLFVFSCAVWGTYDCAQCRKTKPKQLWRAMDGAVELVIFHKDLQTTSGTLIPHCHRCAEAATRFDCRITIPDDRTDRVIGLPSAIQPWARNFTTAVDEYLKEEEDGKHNEN